MSTHAIRSGSLGSPRLLGTLALLSACAPRGAGSSGQALATSLAREISVTEDMTVFTLFAALNVAGYDDENREAGMHPTRLAVRRAVEHRVLPGLRQALRDFYERHRESASTWSYLVAAKATVGPPSFAPTAEWIRDLAPNERFGQLAGLHDLLRRFYVEADVAQLYDSVRPAYREYIQAYRDAILAETASALRYCRVSLPRLTATEERRNPVVVPNLLDSFERASSFILEDHFISVEGPQEHIGYNPHEFIHAVSNPAVYAAETESLRERLGPLVEAGRRALEAPSNRYPTVAAFVDENLVRAVSLRYLVPRHPERESALGADMLDEWKAGYNLMRFFWEQLGLYERQPADLRAYYPTMLTRLDPEAELERWRTARNGQ